jgi:hypothetical protein
MSDVNKSYSVYTVSAKEDMSYILKNINGLIRIKVPDFKESCAICNIDYIEANYKISLNDTYLTGLFDTKGLIDIDYEDNEIACDLYLKYTEYTSKLNFDNLIENSSTPTIILHGKHPKLVYRFITFKFQGKVEVHNLIKYFNETKLYSERNSYRARKSKDF